MFLRSEDKPCVHFSLTRAWGWWGGDLFHPPTFLMRKEKLEGMNALPRILQDVEAGSGPSFPKAPGLSTTSPFSEKASGTGPP